MLGLLIVLLIALIILYHWLVNPPNFPPGPLGIPIFGYYPFLDKKNPSKTFKKLGKIYGKVIGLRVAHLKIVCVSGWEAVKEVFMNEDFTNRPKICFNEDRFNGNNYGMAFINGDFLKTQKRFTLHHFRNLGFGKKAHEVVILEEVEALINEIKLTNREPFETELPLSLAALNIIWEILGGERFQRTDVELKRFYENVSTLMHTVPITGNIFVFIPSLRYLLPNYSGHTRIKTAGNEASAFIKKSIDEHKASRDPNEPRDFIDLYLNEIDMIRNSDRCSNNTYTQYYEKENKQDLSLYFNEAQLEALCIDIMVGGSDTTAATLSFGILFLSLDQNLQNKLQKEIDEHVPSTRLPSLADRNNLVLVDATIMEVLRFRNPAPITVPHCAVRNSQLQGYSVPKETIVLVDLSSVMMDKDYWGDPEVFRPQRFISDSNTLRRDPQMLPFGKGRRSCVGESLARISTFLLFASLVQAFKFELDPRDKGLDTEGIPGFTLGPPKHKIIFTPRFNE